MTITINGFDTASINSAINQLEQLREDKTQEACIRVAEYGAQRAQTTFSFASYDGVNDVKVVAEPTIGGARVRASGNAVLFIEYGAGAKHGYGHPRPQGYGPGTYPGKGHWNDPNGWIYGGIGSGKSRVPLRTWGNPPACAMYNAEQDMYYRAYELASEVFK